MPAVSTLVGWNPSGASCRRTKLFASSPAPIRSTNERAVSATTSARRRRRLPPPSPAPDDPSFRPDEGFAPEAWKAGARPKATAATSAGAEGEEQDRRVEADLRHPRQVGGKPGLEPLQSREGEADAECAARDGEKDAFRQELPQQARSARAEGRPDGDLARAAARPREQEVGDVGAGDGEDEANGAEQYEQRRSHAGDEAFGQGNDLDSPALILLRILARERRLHGRELGLRVGRCRPALQAPDDPQVVAPAPLAQVGEHRVVRQRQPELDPRRLGRRLESRRHDADDHDGLLVEKDRLADDRRIGAQSARARAVRRAPRPTGPRGRRRSPRASGRGSACPRASGRDST